MPLPQISAFFELREVETMKTLLIRQQTEIATQRMLLERMERKIAKRLEGIEDALHLPLDRIETVTLPERRVLYLRHNYAASDDIQEGRHDRYAGIFMLLEEEDPQFPASSIFPAGT
ncbi:hypothetical protein [Saccharibacillus sacchari]|uniref:hypothetical protein n=1 Tax=Saccharibacillus sacchari TaxID=456493 RepID=UPI0004B9C360|nr:hypothetical protein [Saccharibacillus sacchari]